MNGRLPSLDGQDLRYLFQVWELDRIGILYILPSRWVMISRPEIEIASDAGAGQNRDSVCLTKSLGDDKQSFD